MKKYTFENYRRLMDCAGPKTRERILDAAAQDKTLELEDFVRLCELPEQYGG